MYGSIQNLFILDTLVEEVLHKTTLKRMIKMLKNQYLYLGYL